MLEVCQYTLQPNDVAAHSNLLCKFIGILQSVAAGESCNFQLKLSNDFNLAVSLQVDAYC